MEGEDLHLYLYQSDLLDIQAHWEEGEQSPVWLRGIDF